MPKKIYILTESQIQRVVDEVIKEQSEKIYTDFDKAWDYKLSNNQWYGSRKGTNKWLSLANYPDAIKKLNNRYNPKPVAQTAQNVAKTVNTTANKIKSTTSTFPEKLRSTGDAIMDKVDEFGNKIKSASDVIGNKLNAAGDVISDKLSATGDAISNKVKEGVGDIKGFMRKMAPNVAQMFFTRPLTGSDFTKSQRNVIYNVIQNAIKKGKKRERGVTDYSDYGGKIKEIFDTKTGASTKDILLRTATDPYFQVASTLGAFTYQLQKDGTYKIIDTYDFSKGIGYTVSKEEIKGMSFLEQMSYVMKKDNLTPYRAARQIAYIEHPDTADENDKVKISLIINPKEFSA